jgi:hypothetical protein
VELQTLTRQLSAAYRRRRRVGVAIADATGVHPFIKTFVGAFLALLMTVVGLSC